MADGLTLALPRRQPGYRPRTDEAGIRLHGCDLAVVTRWDDGRPGVDGWSATIPSPFVLAWTPTTTATAVICADCGRRIPACGSSPLRAETVSARPTRAFARPLVAPSADAATNSASSATAQTLGSSVTAGCNRTIALAFLAAVRSRSMPSASAN